MRPSTGLSFLFLVLLLLSSFPPGRPDLELDKVALRALRAAVGRSVLSWNDSRSPCSWQGVACELGRVTQLRLPGVGLIGAIPAGVLGNLTELHTLSLRFNALSGTPPADLASLIQLRNLYLQDNSFSGPIPVSIFALRNLIRLNLGGNRFSGGISSEFDNLKRLHTLYLDRNQLSGLIPELNLTLDQFNVSYNQLNGPIPRRFRSMTSDAFIGLQVCGLPSNPCPGESAPVSKPAQNGDEVGDSSGRGKKKKLSAGAIAGIVIGAVVGLLVVMLLLCVCCREKSGIRTRSLDAGAPKPPEAEMPIRDKGIAGGNGAAAATTNSISSATSSASSAAIVAKGDSKNGHIKKLIFFVPGPGLFDLEGLLRASAEVLGKGTFGTAYKAMLEVGTVVTVKRLRDVELPEDDFREKIEAVGTMKHPNLVPLVAYYYSKEEKLLVYDYMPMGSLSAMLHGSRGSGHSPLHWEKRVSIALATARGIEYIHSTAPEVAHGNIKSSNVLLEKPYNARVSDHGLVHVAGPATQPNRLSGYRAPEVTDARKVSQKADVYSFGVLLLELLTGKAPAQALLNEEGIDLPRWVQSVVREEWTSEVFDLELLRYQNAEDEMVQLLQLAIDCAAQYPDKRPAMSVVVNRIEEIQRSSAEAEERYRQQRAAVDDADDLSSRRTHSADGSGPPASSSVFD